MVLKVYGILSTVVKQLDVGLSTSFGNEAKPRIFLRDQDESNEALNFVSFYTTTLKKTGID